MSGMDALKLLRCPACRARFRGDEPADEPCRRCGGDLALLRRVYANADILRRRARRAVAAGESSKAVALARRAVLLVNCAETRLTLGAALVLAERPAAALAICGDGVLRSTD